MNPEAPNDVEAIYRRLLADLREPGEPMVQTEHPQLTQLGRQAIVCAGSPDISTRKVGALNRKIRGLVFRLTRFYVDPLMLQQRSFNLSLVRYIAELERRIAELEGDQPSGDR